MTWTWRKSPWLPAALGAGCGLACLPATAVTNLPAATNWGIRTNLAAPQLPPARSPVDAFRTLLLMSAAEQQKLLAVRPPDIRARILEKIDEYRSLTPEERASRLQATELRWYLAPLLNMPATNRAAHLALIPQPARERVETSLQRWTLLPPTIRQVLLTNQGAVSYLMHFGGRTNAPSPPTEALRQKMQQTVERFLALTQREKEKTLGSFSEVERQQMEKTLAAFEQLTPAQRGRCVRSFAKFATMSPEARQEFLKNAERWAQMSQAERQAWRELVSRAPSMPPLPQLPNPPRVSVTSKPPAVANGN